MPDLQSCRASLSAVSCTDDKEEAQTERGGMGQEAVPLLGVLAPGNSFYTDRPDTSLCPQYQCS